MHMIDIHTEQKDIVLPSIQEKSYFSPDNIKNNPLNSVSGKIENTFQRVDVIKLSNLFYELELLPHLSGVVQSVLDKRTGVQILNNHSNAIAQVEDGILALDAGIEWVVQPRASNTVHTLPSIEPVQYEIVELESQPSGGVILYSQNYSASLSWQASIQLHAETSKVVFSCRITNRSLLPVSITAGLKFHGFEPQTISCLDSYSTLCLFNRSNQSGFFVDLVNGSPFQLNTLDSHTVVDFIPEEKLMMPFETFGWKLEGSFASGIEKEHLHSSIGLLSKHDESLELLSHKNLEKQKIILVTKDKGNLEHIVDLKAGQKMKISTRGISNAIERVIVRDTNHKLDWIDTDTLKEYALNVLEAYFPKYHSDMDHHISSLLEKEGISTSIEAKYFEKAKEIDSFNSMDGLDIPFESSYLLRHAGFILKSILFVRNKKYVDALSCLEKALHFDSENIIAWWMRSVCKRNMGEMDDENLVNIEYISCLEPLLFSEKFLYRGIENYTEEIYTEINNGWIGLPIKNHLEVIYWYLVIGSYDDACELLNSIKDIQKHPILNCILAYIYLEDKDLKLESYSHLNLAKEQKGFYPYPIRRHELTIMKHLSCSFSKEKWLIEMVGFMEGLCKNY